MSITTQTQAEFEESRRHHTTMENLIALSLQDKETTGRTTKFGRKENTFSDWTDEQKRKYIFRLDRRNDYESFWQSVSKQDAEKIVGRKIKWRDINPNPFEPKENKND